MYIHGKQQNAASLQHLVAFPHSHPHSTTKTSKQQMQPAMGCQNRAHKRRLTNAMCKVIKQLCSQVEAVGD
ncbi:hypothetical protein TcWFU_001018 [Taenia crassiceps]|uniref:Uncharacterized protein n=1 Tax=Taenia crassiceps TaxID=6207 RepID=A0ABR4Q488_9CEST